MYLYRAVDSEGNTIDFYLSKSRNHKAAKRFFQKALRSFHVSKPRIITVDKNPAYPIAIEQLKKEKRIPIGTKIRRIKYFINNRQISIFSSERFSDHFQTSFIPIRKTRYYQIKPLS